VKAKDSLTALAMLAKIGRDTSAFLSALHAIAARIEQDAAEAPKASGSC
jgi:hypothetical protein